MILSGRGMALSVLSSVLFAVMPVYFNYLEPLDGVQVLTQRILWSIPMVLLLLVLTRQGAMLRQALARLLREPRLILALIGSTLLVGSQWGVFVWATMTGHTLDITLGYFLLPLVMVIVGRMFYGEEMRPLYRVAVVFALIGVIHEWWATGAFSWVTLVSALGYPPYFMLRRWMKIDALSGFILEMLCMTPLAIVLLYFFSPASALQVAPSLWILLPGLGLLSAVAFGAMMAASRLLPMGLFGILSYIEPALLVFVAILLLDEAFVSSLLWTYGPIWTAVLLVCLDSARLLKKQLRRGLENV
ncbi:MULTISPECIES: EamA family transporter RarD [Pseudomonas]|uniref:Chloramphenicol-sensitive protein RarD n=1 Tax=Pseudomonas lutea TaxID=243924 RepID=A0A9X8ME18_9PSED|nr:MULTISPECIES: EamA family transporter RarD [Pseudomonas]SEQ78713.1 chloramphenicol-sensitive protein RarD [Pseudomonas lutea]